MPYGPKPALAPQHLTGLIGLHPGCFLGLCTHMLPLSAGSLLIPNLKRTQNRLALALARYLTLPGSLTNFMVQANIDLAVSCNDLFWQLGNNVIVTLNTTLQSFALPCSFGNV